MLNIILPFLGTGEAAAEGQAPGMLDGLMSMLPMIAIFGLLMYFMLYRPQKKQQRAVEEMRSGLRVGDEISTTGGILGKIIQIKEEFVIIETGNDKTKLKITKWAVRAVEHREEEEDDEEDDED